MNEKEIKKIETINELTSNGSDTDRAVILAYAQGLAAGKKLVKDAQKNEESENEKEREKE